MIMRQLCRRVLKIERHLSPNALCTTCGGYGRLVVRILDDTPLGQRPAAPPRGCPTCGEALIVTITDDDQPASAPAA